MRIGITLTRRVGQFDANLGRLVLAQAVDFAYFPAAHTAQLDDAIKGKNRMSDNYQRGSMDVSAHEQTWKAFATLVKWSSIGAAVTLFILTVWLG